MLEKAIEHKGKVYLSACSVRQNNSTLSFKLLQPTIPHPFVDSLNMSAFTITCKELLAKLCHVELDFFYDDNFEDWMFVVMELILHGWLEYKHVQYVMRDMVGMLVSKKFLSSESRS